MDSPGRSHQNEEEVGRDCRALPLHKYNICLRFCYKKNVYHLNNLFMPPKTTGTYFWDTMHKWTSFLVLKMERKAVKIVNYVRLLFTVLLVIYIVVCEQDLDTLVPFKLLSYLTVSLL